MPSKHEYEHYVLIKHKKYAFYYSDTAVFNPPDLEDPDYPDHYILDIGDTPEEKEALDSMYTRYPEDEAFFIVPKHDIQCIGAKPRNYP